MVTTNGTRYWENNKVYFWLSTDTKPSDGVNNGDFGIEMDTSKIYFYDAAGAQWLEWTA